MVIKKFVVASLALGLVASLGFAAPKAAKASSADTLFVPGNLSVLAGIGSGIFSGFDVYGGVEYDLGSFDIAQTIPITWGVAGRVGYYGYTESWYGMDWSYSDLSIGAVGVAHLSLKSLIPDQAWAAKFDFYAGLGLGTYLYSWDFDDYYGSSSLDKGSDFHLGFAGVAGTNWFITDRIAINFEGGYYGYGGAGRIGVLFKL